MKVTSHVRAVQVPDDSPMHPQSTNIYLVGDNEVLSIDSGEAIDKFRWMLRGYLAAMEQTEIALAGITHHHWDHSGNLKEIREALGADVAVPENAIDLLKGRLPDSGVQTLRDGQSIDLDKGIHVQVLATPGHSVDSLCYYLEEDGVLFTGDTLLGVGTTTVRDLGDYRRSLQRLVDLPNLKVLCPGHGPLVYDARERLRTYINHRNMREEQIIDTLRAGGPQSSWDIMLKLYRDLDTRLRSAADGNVRAHLVQLEEEGRISVTPGKKRKPNPAKAAKQKLKDGERRKVIRQAQRYEADDRRQSLAAQENPPTDQWSRQPTYEIKDSD
jgi:glyoxylase-like metal-dependent hydrolase (beta-lactamase superfamily II)